MHPSSLSRTRVPSHSLPRRAATGEDLLALKTPSLPFKFPLPDGDPEKCYNHLATKKEKIINIALPTTPSPPPFLTLPGALYRLLNFRSVERISTDSKSYYWVSTVSSKYVYPNHVLKLRRVHSRQRIKNNINSRGEIN